MRRFYGILNSLGLYNKNAKILFLVRPRLARSLCCDVQRLARTP